MTPADLPDALAFSFLGYPLRLAEPGALRLLAVVLVLAVLGVVALARRRMALVRAAGSLAPRVAPGANRTRPAARLGLALLGLTLLAVALSRPQCGTRLELEKPYGVDLAIVLDASRSMLATDVKADRLARAKLELGALLDGLGGDRVGIVVFAADAFVRCPLTSDRAAAKVFLRAVEPDALPRQGTALAPALAAARGLLLASGSRARSKVVLVVSDGEDHQGGVASAAQALARDGIRLFALAVGTVAGAPVPPRAGAPARSGRTGPVVTRLDLATLHLVADQGGGEVYDVSSPDHDLAAFRAALDRMARSEVEGRVTVSYEDRYALAAFPGFLLLLASLLVREARAPGASAPSGRRAGAGAAALLAALLAGFSPFQTDEENVRAGNDLLRAGDAVGAARAYDEAERAAGPHPEIDFDRGNAAAREGRLEDARAAWERAAAAAPAPLASHALQNLGTALAAVGDREGALRAITGALARDPSNQDARWDLEVLLRKTGERRDQPGERGASGPGPGQAEAALRPGPASATGGTAGSEGQPDAEDRATGGASGGPRREPLSRQETEALLDALRDRERPMPFSGRGRGRGTERSQDANEDW